MSRNKREGRYCGKMQGKHYRTRGVNCTVSTLDCHLEIEFKEMKKQSSMFNTIAEQLGWPFKCPLSGFGWS